MIEEQARVIRIHSRAAEIQVQRQSACNRCELSSGCGTGAIGRLLGHRNKPLMLATGHQLKEGDQLLLGMPEASFLKASLLIYGLPLFGLLLGSIFGFLISGGIEAVVLAGCVGGFFGGCLISMKLSKERFSSQLSPQILKINNEPID